MLVVALAAAGVFGLAVALLAVGYPWPALSGLRDDEIAAIARLSRDDQTGGLEALKTSYGWRQDRWMILARGSGAFVVALVLALVGATLQADRVVVEKPLGEQPRGGVSAGKRTTTESRTSPEAFVLASVGLVVAVGAWGRSRALQLQYGRDVRRVSELVP